MGSFAIFGNPIKHSKSAEIYSIFAKEIGISEKYDIRLVSFSENFDDVLLNFFKTGGLGANITIPFKERSFLLCDQLTDRARCAGSINTIKRKDNGILLGDNTDGIGFISDLKRLGWINEDYIFMKKDLEKEKNHILLIGAGGAARGIISVLLTMVQECYVDVINRTDARAQELVSDYRKNGYRNVLYKKLDNFQNDNIKYDLIINATASSMYNDIPNIPSYCIKPDTKCYDLFYCHQDTFFLKWCKYYGSNYCSDGLGMLVEQAAHSFHLWHSVLPDTTIAFSYLKSII